MIVEPVKVCGLNVYPFRSVGELLRFISNKHTILAALGAEKLLSKDKRFRDIINRHIGYADGIGTVYALGRKGFRVPKIPGASLWLDIVRHFRDRTFYFLGAREKVVSATCEKVTREHGIEVIGYHDGYFDEVEFLAIRRSIQLVQPDIVFVAMGSPRQEFIMAELMEYHSALYVGLGGSLDLYTGNVRPVPRWWTTIFKWEGLYRQFYDLRNIQRWKRQFRVLPIIWRILAKQI